MVMRILTMTIAIIFILSIWILIFNEVFHNLKSDIVKSVFSTTFLFSGSIEMLIFIYYMTIYLLF